jgi:anti-sigma factor RsiW
MTCNEIREKLPLHLHGDLPAQESGLVKQHCEACPVCRKELATLQQVGHLLDAVPTPRVEVNLAQVYALTVQQQAQRMRRWRRATIALAGVAALLLLVFGLKPQVTVQAHQVVVAWGHPSESLQTGAKREPELPFQAIVEAAQPRPQVTVEDMKLVKDLIHALATDIDSRDQRQREAISQLVKNLEAFQYGDNQRWKATQRDVAALITVCLGPHERDKGGKP